MNKFLNSAARVGGLAALTVSLSACGPEDMARVGALPHFALPAGIAPLGMSLQAAPQFAPVYDAPYPEALPLQPAVFDYGLAPSWDYASNGYADYAPVDPYQFQGYDDGYYAPGDAGYYAPSAGSDDYAWLALASLIAGVLGNSPPDYGFDYGGVQPWAWRTGDGYARYAEPIHGGNRYYYYAPNAARPFLVRDPYYSYGYRDDRLVAIYDRDGRMLSQHAALRHRLAAQNYFERARLLHRASLAERRYGVSAPIWTKRQPIFAADQRRWREAREQRIAWSQWNDRHERDLYRRWDREREAREHAAERFEGWRDASYRGPAPRFYEAQRREAERRERALADRQDDRREAALKAQREANELLRDRRETLAERREDGRERTEQVRHQATQREATQRRQQLALRQQQQQAQERREAAERVEQRERSEARERAERQPAQAERREAEQRSQVREQRAARTAAEAREAAQTRREQAAAEARQQEAREQRGAQQAARTRRDAQESGERAEAAARETAQARSRQAAQDRATAQSRQQRSRAAEQARERQAQGDRAEAQARRQVAQAEPREQPRAQAAVVNRASVAADGESRAERPRARPRSGRGAVRAER